MAPLPPAKQAALLGRFSGHMSLGLCGLPNCGKSTLFNTMTKLSVPAENRCFCTIDPNRASVSVPDERFDWLCEVVEPKKATPASIDIVDIAGLVRGAHKGEGLGNAFLSHIQSVDGIFHVVRVFEDDNIAHFEGSVDPVRDLEIIAEELRMKDHGRMLGLLENHQRKFKAPSLKDQKEERAMLEKFVAHLETADINTGDWTDDEIRYLNSVGGLLTAKPIVYLLNMSERDYRRQKNRFIPQIIAWIKARTPDAEIVPYCGSYEYAISTMTPEAAAAYIEEQKMPSMAGRIITAGYRGLSLEHYYTAGEVEVRCWTIRKGSLAPQAAGVIHTDFEKTFIGGEIVHFADMREQGSVANARASGVLHQVGKTYVVEDGDVCTWKAGAARSRK